MNSVKSRLLSQIQKSLFWLANYTGSKANCKEYKFNLESLYLFISYLTLQMLRQICASDFKSLPFCYAQ